MTRWPKAVTRPRRAQSSDVVPDLESLQLLQAQTVLL